MAICLERGETCLWPSWYHCHSLSLASVKSRLVLPFWYRLTRVVLEKGPLNRRVCYVRTYAVRWLTQMLLGGWTGRFRGARFRGRGEDESVSLHVRRAVLRRDEVQAATTRGAGRGRRHRRYVESTSVGHTPAPCMSPPAATQLQYDN